MTELESSKCYQISVTAVNAKGNSTPVVIDFSCDRVKETLVRKWEAIEYLCNTYMKVPINTSDYKKMSVLMSLPGGKW